MSILEIVGKVEGLLMRGDYVSAQLFVQEYASMLPEEVRKSAELAIFERKMANAAVKVQGKSRDSETASAKAKFYDLFKKEVTV